MITSMSSQTETSMPSGSKKRGHHARNLSELFLDAASIAETSSTLSDARQKATLLEKTSESSKHRRLFSGDDTNAQGHYGLEILSTASVQDHHQQDGAIINTSSSSSVPRQSLGMVSTGSADQQLPESTANNVAAASFMYNYPGMYTSHHPGATAALHANNYSSNFPIQMAQRPTDVYSTYDALRYNSNNNINNNNYTLPPSSLSMSAWDTQHRGSQTFVTGLAVGDGTKVLQPSQFASTTNATTTTTRGHHRKLSSFSSTLNSILGSHVFAGPDTMMDATTTTTTTDLSGHHRKTSSTLSFLQNMADAGLEASAADDVFLRNLQASNAGLAAAYEETKPEIKAVAPTRAPSTMTSTATNTMMTTTGSQHYNHSNMTVNSAADNSGDVSDNDTEDNGEYSTRLAPGGTSKRVRRKCSMGNCDNRVVQGGLCIAHGAKRKQCKHPGCDKNVKKAGLCSAHGPARKRCDVPNCLKVAVQGGRCIGHGAKKKLCYVNECSKQAIINGMCKRHHDLEQNNSTKSNGSASYCQPVGVASAAPTVMSERTTAMEVGAAGAAKARAGPGHQRGLSIFQEMSADAVSSLLNEAAPANNNPYYGA
jgi:hypothetical protein